MTRIESNVAEDKNGKTPEYAIGARFEHAFHRCERCLLLRSTLAELKQFAVSHF